MCLVYVCYWRYSSLFFSCQHSAYIWSLCKLKLRLTSIHHLSLEEEYHALSQNFKGSAKETTLARIVLRSAVWHIWKDKNVRIFQQSSRHKILVFFGASMKILMCHSEFAIGRPGSTLIQQLGYLCIWFLNLKIVLSYTSQHSWGWQLGSSPLSILLFVYNMFMIHMQISCFELRSSLPIWPVTFIKVSYANAVQTCVGYFCKLCECSCHHLANQSSTRPIWNTSRGVFFLNCYFRFSHLLCCM